MDWSPTGDGFPSLCGNNPDETTSAQLTSSEHFGSKMCCRFNLVGVNSKTSLKAVEDVGNVIAGIDFGDSSSAGEAIPISQFPTKIKTTNQGGQKTELNPFELTFFHEQQHDDVVTGSYLNEMSSSSCHRGELNPTFSSPKPNPLNGTRGKQMYSRVADSKYWLKRQQFTSESTSSKFSGNWLPSTHSSRENQPPVF